MLQKILAGIAPPPPLGTGLWLTLGGLLLAGLNVTFHAEIWPHTPYAKAGAAWAIWLLLVLLLPQLLLWAWRWLRAYTGPAWVRLLATAGFLGLACFMLGVWLVIVFSGPVAILWWD